jgi:DNA-directed RNA polymerase specialized sigma24 family protein
MEFETLANQHKDEVYRQMIRACGNREDAKDVLVEALLKAHRHLGQLRDGGAFRAWLAQIARRVCWQLKKREAVKSRLHRARESVRNALDVALIQHPGAKKFVGKKVGVSPRHGGEALNREG